MIVVFVLVHQQDICPIQMWINVEYVLVETKPSRDVVVLMVFPQITGMILIMMGLVAVLL